MKRILLSLSLLAAVFCSAAAQDTEVIKAYLKSMGSSTVVFTMSGTGLDGNTISQQKGVVQVQYPCFKIESGGQEIISDGTTTWIYNIATQEVVITGAMLEPMLPDASLNLNNSGKPLLKFSNKNGTSMTFTLDNVTPCEAWPSDHFVLDTKARGDEVVVTDRR
ncbi:MAG: outer membrane lipoprotein carrier protein LolA [Bacteroidales bacterium]|nr:outer membrane lipoprotein carrier protein LolA [Bacteroidales bacterium]